MKKACHEAYALLLQGVFLDLDNSRGVDCQGVRHRETFWWQAMIRDAQIAAEMGDEVPTNLASKAIDALGWCTSAYNMREAYYIRDNFADDAYYEQLGLYIKLRRLDARLRNNPWSELLALHEHVAYLRWAHDRQCFHAPGTLSDAGDLHLSAFLLALAEEERGRFVEAKFVSNPPREPEPLLPKEDAEIFGLPYNLLLP